MKTDLNKQRAAVAIALKEKKRELAKAQESGRTEWVEDCQEEILALTDAVETLKLLEQFSLLLGRLQ